MPKLSEAMKKYIVDEIERLPYGTVAIEVNQSSPVVFVTTTQRTRLQREEEQNTEGEKIFHNG